MSTVSLDPVVARKLKQFGRRRWRLIVARGLCAGIVTFLLCMSAVAVIDWYWLLSDNVRWGLSGTAYLAVVAVVWSTCLRRLMTSPAKEVLASYVESIEPELRENLLSAVELATDDPSAIHDSPVFRGLLQGKVAKLMSEVRVPRLLPARLVAKWMLAAIVLVAGAAFLLTLDDPRFRQLASRAIMPGANIARVSRIHVEVLQPTPHSLTLAEDETVAVVVEVTGGSVNEVTLETFTPNQGAVRQVMRGRTDIEFAANIHVANEAVEYRILAGDAVTQRFRIESRPRPRVTAFHKTFTYPDYAGLDVETITETHGDLLVLEGTQAELVLEIDQGVSEAELRIDLADSDEVQVIPLTRVEANQHSEHANSTKKVNDAVSVGREPRPTAALYKAIVPVDVAAIYKVHLVSEETGFENIFSPKYEIQPQPDLIPRTGFVDLEESTLLLPPTDIVAFKAMAEDDLPLVSLEQHISINGAEWQALPLTTESDTNDQGRHVSAAWQWDLLEHQLKAGDQVTTKLVATDRKGHQGESIPLRIVVAAQDFDPQRHAIMERKVSLYRHLADFSELLEEHKASALEVIERLRKPDRNVDEVKLDRATLLDLASKQREQAEQLLAEVKAVEREMPAGADAYDLELTGRVIARLQQEHANAPDYLVKAIQHTDDEQQIKRDLDSLKQTFERTADDAKNVAILYQQLMSHNFLTAIASDLDALLRQQQFVVDSSTQTWERLLRHETVVVNQLRVLEKVIAVHRRDLPSHIDSQARGLMNWSELYRQRFQDATESEEKLDQLRRLSQDFLKQLESKQRMDAVDSGLPGRLVGIRRDFDNRAGSLYTPLYEMGRAVQQENSLAAKAIESQDSAEGKKLLDQAERFVAEVDLKHRRSLDQLRSRRELTQLRPDSDSQYAADAGLTHRATTSLLYQHRQVAPQESTIPENLLEVAPAYRTLEAGHNLILARDALNVLVNMERWGSQTIRSHMDHPRQWDVVQQGFELAAKSLREARVENDLVAKLDQIRSSTAVRDAGRKITERRWKRDAIVSAGHELVETRDDLAKVVNELEPVMAEARAIIAKFAPTIPQMAEQAAEQLRQLEEETIATADKAEESATPESDTQLSELQRQQQDINQRLQDLTEALVEDANSQDVLDEQQRERARDADDSIAMIQEPTKQMNQAMQRAEDSQSKDQQAKELARAAEQQERTAQALDLVAKHFEQLDEGMDVAESRAELRQNERESGIARQMDEQFEQAETFAKMAAQDNQQLLAELEAELQRNPAMQQALSEISKNAIQEARNSLQFAAQDDSNLERANERADQEFLAKKRELAAELREMAAEASRLSGALVAQAEQMAARGKTPEAQKKFSETRQQLNEAAAKANAARDDQLLDDLAQSANEAKAAIEQATETLKQGKQQAATGKDENIHADDKAREAAKKDAERSWQRFHDQQKRAAQDVVKRADGAKRNADNSLRNAEKQVANIDRQIQQAKKNLSRKPEDAGLKRNLEREEARKAAEEKKVAAAKQVQQKAEQEAKLARQKADEVNKMKLPPLDAVNPATQLADQYADEAIKLAEDLKKQAEQIAATTDFGKELATPQNQLAAAETQQQNITEDVRKAAEDVARAARHERRLDNAAVAEPLQNASKTIEQVASNESEAAEQQLAAASQEAQLPEGSSQADSPRKNGETLQAQQAIRAAEEAIERQATQLTEVLQPMIAAAEASQQQQAESGDAANAAAPSPQSNASPETQARAEQLAKVLDELDRQQQGQSSQPTPATPETLAQAARAQQAAMATARTQAQQQAALAMSENATESLGEPANTGAMSDFEVAAVNRDEDKEWGALRNKSAEDLGQGTSETVAEDYRKSVATYFRVLAERARRKK